MCSREKVNFSGVTLRKSPRVLDLCVGKGSLPTGNYSIGRKARMELTGDEKCKMVRGSRCRCLHREPILIQMTRQHVGDKGGAETDSRGKKEIKEILYYIAWLFLPVS